MRQSEGFRFGRVEVGAGRQGETAGDGAVCVAGDGDAAGTRRERAREFEHGAADGVKMVDVGDPTAMDVFGGSFDTGVGCRGGGIMGRTVGWRAGREGVRCEALGIEMLGVGGGDGVCAGTTAEVLLGQGVG